MMSFLAACREIFSIRNLMDVTNDLPKGSIEKDSQTLLIERVDDAVMQNFVYFLVLLYNGSIFLYKRNIIRSFFCWVIVLFVYIY